MLFISLSLVLSSVYRFVFQLMKMERAYFLSLPLTAMTWALECTLNGRCHHQTKSLFRLANQVMKKSWRRKKVTYCCLPIHFMMSVFPVL